MIDVERLKARREVVFHGSCPDGTSSALVCQAALMRLGVEAEYRSVQYGTDAFEKMEPAPGQLFVDITPPRARWEEWAGTDVVVLDHHESAKHIVEGLGGVFGLNETHSGARLAFEHVFSPVGGVSARECAEWDRFTHLSMVRDTWKSKSPDWEEACHQAYGLTVFGASVCLEMQKAGRFDPALVMRLGKKAFGRATLLAGSAFRRPFWCDPIGRDLVVGVINCTEARLVSDACHVLLDSGVDVAVSYFLMFQDEVDVMQVSLRTREPWARKIAEANGGGGHDQAAGFRIRGAASVSVDALMTLIIRSLHKVVSGQV